MLVVHATSRGWSNKETDMHDIKKATGTVIAADTQASVTALDQAVLSHARLCASIIEAAGESNLPMAVTQKALQSVAAGIGGLVASRTDMVTTVRAMTLIQMQSNLKETSFGCPDFAGPNTGASNNEPAKADYDVING
jgi:hypothetical protein